MRTTPQLRVIVAVGLVSTVVLATAAATTSLAPSAGTGVEGATGDGGLAVAATLNHPTGLSALPDGGYLIADQDNNRIRRVWSSGKITTVGGSAEFGFGGDGGPATAAGLWGPSGVAALPDGGYVVADRLNSRVRRVEANGTIRTIAGTGEYAFSGDNGPAIDASLDRPAGVAVTADGSIIVADQFNNRVRRISPTGTITTLAGTGSFGSGGDGGPAVVSELNLPAGVSVADDGAVLVADQGNHRIRMISPSGTITTVAGTGEPGFAGDGGPAVAARLDSPASVTALAAGGFLVADHDNQRVRRVGADGTIATVAGDGTFDPFAGGEVAGPTQLSTPAAAVIDTGGRLLVADATDNRVRVVGDPGPQLPLVLGYVLGEPTPAPLRLRAIRVSNSATGVRVVYSISDRARLALWVRPMEGGRPTRVSIKAAAQGRGVIAWRGRLQGRPVPPGRYVLIVTARAGEQTARDRIIGRLMSR